jgi:arylsulfatase A-like enzyme
VQSLRNRNRRAAPARASGLPARSEPQASEAHQALFLRPAKVPADTASSASGLPARSEPQASEAHQALFLRPARVPADTASSASGLPARSEPQASEVHQDWSLRARQLLAAALLLALACAPAPQPLRGAVVVLLDTWRHDKLSAELTPNIDALAARGTRFEQAVSASSWTLPAMVSLFAGRQPSARDFDDVLTHSLVEKLQAAGIHTAAITEGGFVSRVFGLDRGFEHFLEHEGPVKLDLAGETRAIQAASVETTFGMARRWLLQRAPGERFFLFVHTYAIHAPYQRAARARGLPRGALRETFELSDLADVRAGRLAIGETEQRYLEALYDGGVAAADAAVGQLLATLDASGLARDTLVIVTSDHGEDLGGRDPKRAGDHGHTLFDELVRIPLVVADPGIRAASGVRISEQVRLYDVLPTVLERLGARTPEALDGRSLVPLLRGARKGEERPARLALARDGALQLGLRVPQRKLLRAESRGDGPRRDTRYDLSGDPRERSPSAPSAEEAAALEAYRSELASEGFPDWEAFEHAGPELEARLRELGYVE